MELINSVLLRNEETDFWRKNADAFSREEVEEVLDDVDRHLVQAPTARGCPDWPLNTSPMR